MIQVLCSFLTSRKDYRSRLALHNGGPRGCTSGGEPTPQSTLRRRDPGSSTDHRARSCPQDGSHADRSVPTFDASVRCSFYGRRIRIVVHHDVHSTTWWDTTFFADERHIVRGRRADGALPMSFCCKLPPGPLRCQSHCVGPAYIGLWRTTC